LVSNKKAALSADFLSADFLSADFLSADFLSADFLLAFTKLFYTSLRTTKQICQDRQYRLLSREDLRDCCCFCFFA
ncbi:MAG: hypothetical protein ACK46E_06020, partial [Pseudanabaena sp.]